MILTKNISQHAATAKAIKQELKMAFPDIKFSVNSDSFAGGDSVRIKWTDGPTDKSVHEITSKYQYGHFNGMEDIYEYSNRIENLPQTKYIQTSRYISDEKKEIYRKLLAQEYGREIFTDNDYLDWCYGGCWGNNAIYRYMIEKNL
jgi:hypothetical protein